MKKSLGIILTGLFVFLNTAHAEVLHCQSTQVVDVNEGKFFAMKENKQFVKDNSVRFDLEYQGLGLLNANSLVFKQISIKNYPVLQNVKLSESSGIASKTYIAKFPNGVRSAPEGQGEPPLTNIDLEFDRSPVNGKLTITFATRAEDREGSYGNIWFMACHSGAVQYDPN
jgi:hypothetical protein